MENGKREDNFPPKREKDSFLLENKLMKKK